MFKKGKAYLIIGILALGLLVVFESNKPKNINWFPSYVSTHKIPYGTKVFNDLSSKYFKEITQVYKTPYEYLSNNSDAKGTYIFINEEVSFSETDTNELLQWVENGNHLFIASEYFDYKFLDTLNLQTSSTYNPYSINPKFTHKLVNSSLEIKPVTFEKDYYATTFSSIDTLKTVVLGEVSVTNDSTKIEEKSINIIQQEFGSGKITLSTFPKAFTNYFMLKDDNRHLTSGVLAYAKNSGTVFIDNHYKSGKTFHTSPMYLFLNTKELKWAYYIVLIGVLVYIVFEGKRKQRAIKVVQPLKNQTLTFTKTIADMYFENNRQGDIAKHKIQYFLDYIRTKFYLSTEIIDETFYENLAARTNHSVDQIKGLFKTFESIQKTTHVTNNQLEQLDKKIQNFKDKVNGKQ